MSMLREGSFVLMATVLAITAGISISRLVDSPQRWAEGQVVIHDADTPPAMPATGRLVVKPATRP